MHMMLHLKAKGGMSYGTKHQIQLFEDKRIRTAWDAEKEEGSERVTNCHPLKMTAA